MVGLQPAPRYRGMARLSDVSRPPGGRLRRLILLTLGVQSDRFMQPADQDPDLHRLLRQHVGAAAPSSRGTDVHAPLQLPRQAIEVASRLLHLARRTVL